MQTERGKMRHRHKEYPQKIEKEEICLKFDKIKFHQISCLLYPDAEIALRLKPFGLWSFYIIPYV